MSVFNASSVFLFWGEPWKNGNYTHEPEPQTVSQNEDCFK